jgi:translation elongation factor EF-Tu-like GTPase
MSKELTRTGAAAMAALVLSVAAPAAPVTNTKTRVFLVKTFQLQ